MRRFNTRAVSGFLQKPYTAAELAEKVKSVLAERVGERRRGRRDKHPRNTEARSTPVMAL